MKVVLALVLVGLVAPSLQLNDKELALAFLRCCDKAIQDGLPEAGVPPHNPLVIENVTLPIDILNIHYNVSLTNNILYKLLDYNLTQVDATTYYEPDRVNYDYDIYWPLLNFTGDYDYSYKISPFPAITGSGTYNVLLHHTDFYGHFNMTKPTDSSNGHLDDFLLKIKVKSVDVELTGISFSSAIEAAVELGIYTSLNNVPAAASDFLKEQRFNGYWFSHPERINAIITHCHEAAH